MGNIFRIQAGINACSLLIMRAWSSSDRKLGGHVGTLKICFS